MYKLLLILKYLRRRMIAWCSLFAVMLCTALVIVVISVMGGWLRMFEDSARGMTGDLVIRQPGLSGFAYYDEITRELEKLNYIEAAVPQIKALGLINLYGQKTEGVQVFGVQIDRIGKVNNWPQTLYRQHVSLVEKGQTPPEKKTFDLHPVTVTYLKTGLPENFPVRPAFVGMEKALDGLAGWLPGKSVNGLRGLWDTVPIALGDGKDPAWNLLTYDRWTSQLSFRGKMKGPEATAFTNASQDETWRSAIKILARESNQEGLIAGARVINISRDEQGKIKGREDWKYRELWGKLTVLGIRADQQFDVSDKAERTYWIVDDSRTGMWQYDNSAVYVPFDVLQRDLSMDEHEVEDRTTKKKFKEPARASEIHIKLKPGPTPEQVQKEIEAVVNRVIASHAFEPYAYHGEPLVETWRQSSALYLGAIENEKVLVVFLFGMVSLVTVFLIFCIFYMIVAEKTKDIGIVKSVGATNVGVAGIFLGYGLIIGIVGAFMGLLIAYLIVHNINEIHTYMGVKLGMVIWNPEVYAFDSIPNRMDPAEVSIIMAVAVLSSVLGATVPAILAAVKHPVDALRWE